jgi:hypothetical protein
MTRCCATLQVMNDWGFVRSKECSSCQAEKENSRDDRNECASCQDRKKGKIFEILRVRNRFVVDEGGNDRSSGGYRDISFKIKVGFRVHVLHYCLYVTVSWEWLSTYRNPQVEHRSFYQCEFILPVRNATRQSNFAQQDEMGSFILPDFRLWDAAASFGNPHTATRCVCTVALTRMTLLSGIWSIKTIQRINIEWGRIFALPTWFPCTICSNAWWTSKLTRLSAFPNNCFTRKNK